MSENTTNDDAPEVEHDALIDFMGARIAEEHARGSDASESAAKTNAFLDETKLNSQAFSWMRSVLKKLPKKDGANKAKDILRSLKYMIPMIENHVEGQQPSMDLPEPEPVEDKPSDNGTVVGFK